MSAAMEVVRLTETDAARWDALVLQQKSFSMLQSADWAAAKKPLGWSASRVAIAENGTLVAGAQMLVRPLPFGAGSVAYVPHGPVGRWQDRAVAPALFGALHEIARENGAAFLKVEPATSDGLGPRDTLSELGFTRSAFPNQPLATVVVDIEPEEEAILRAMRDSTRRKIHAATRKGLVVRRGVADDLPTFFGLMRETSQRTGAPLRSPRYYESEFRTFDAKDQAVLLFADHNGQSIAAHVAYAHGRHAAFLHQASSSSRSNLNPNCLLVFEQIRWAKSKGCRTLDLWGVPDEVGELVARGEPMPANRTDGLWGVYRFKSGFSRSTIGSAGSFDFVYSPRVYALASSRVILGMIDRVSRWTDVHHRLGAGGS